MNTYQQLNELFKSRLADFVEYPESRLDGSAFKCKNKDICKVNLDKETCCTPYYGDENSNIMIVAESPSTIYGTGFYFSGFSRNIKSIKKNDNLEIFLNYIVSINNGKYPYFTDLVKCGMEKSNSKELLTTRKKPCIENFLIQEIEILNPKHIICIGNDSYNEIKKLHDLKRINGEIQISKMRHYSNRASLTLSIADKRDIIWPLENKKIKNRSDAEKAILNLEFIKKLIDQINE